MNGTGVALVTPFTSDGKIDFNSLEKIINHIINGGCEYLVVLGTTGESVTLSKDEKKEIYNFAREKNADRVKLVAGIGGNDTADLLKNFSHFDASGYHAILSVSPYYNKPNQNGIFLHYKTIAENSPLPIIIYNVPGRTGSNITTDTTLRLANEEENIIATKEASGNFDQCMDIIMNKPVNFSVISGDDAYTLPFVAIGMSGVISVVANAYPKIYSNMTRAALKNDFETAKNLHYTLLPLIKLLFADGSPGGIKCAMKYLDLCGDTLRMPLANVNKDVENKIKLFVEKLGK